MKKWLKRIRGAVGVGLTWAAAWLGVGVIMGLVFFGSRVDAELLANALNSAVLGFIGGTVFSVALGIAERRATFDQMSLPRFAGWGAVGGLLGPVNTKGRFVLYWGYENHRVPISADRGLLSTSARQCEHLQSRSA